VCRTGTEPGAREVELRDDRHERAIEGATEPRRVAVKSAEAQRVDGCLSRKTLAHLFEAFGREHGAFDEAALPLRLTTEQAQRVAPRIAVRRQELRRARFRRLCGVSTPASRERTLELDELTSWITSIAERAGELEAWRVVAGSGAECGEKVGACLQRAEEHSMRRCAVKCRGTPRQ
jgi:hypothetical protein